MKSREAASGFTLLELLLVIAMVALLASIAIWGNSQMMRDWQLKRAAQQLYEGLKAVQAKAEMSGSVTMSGGHLVAQRYFLVFEQEDNRYSAFNWRDQNGNGIPEPGEAGQLWQTSLPPGVSFAWGQDVDRRACSNGSSPPGNAISFSSPDYPPCNDQPCIKFDQNGFSVMGPGAIYLSNGEQSLAITTTRPGHFTMCEWGGERWR